jgi:phosphoribosylanthranilate isomerase
MKIKVCGMKNPENIKAIRNLEPDFMGFIFYEKSPRYVGENFELSSADLKGRLDKVGVFVNHPTDELIEIAGKYNLDFVQLHGNESVAYVKEIHSAGIKTIKAFQINENFNWLKVKNYLPYINFLLFDTATKNHGGSGLKFDWTLLNNYKEETPFFLSGGIGTEDIEAIKRLNIPQLYGIDINSKVEITPGNKDVELVKKCINEVRNEP